jgi:D-alanine-D-alanine ligase
MKVAVLTGGASSERDVALATGLQVAGALRSGGHTVSVIDLAAGYVPPEREAALLPGGVGREPPPQSTLRALERGMLTAGLGELPAIQGADVIALALHGGSGENGTVQALLDVIGVPYTGSGHLASALAMDKDLSKRVLRDSGVPVAPWLMAPVETVVVAREIGFPCIVKPSNEGSSVGLSLVREAGALPAAIAEAAAWDREVMVERYLVGREFTVGILGERALPVGEIIPKHELFDYECKYTTGMSQEIFPADIPADLAARLADAALAAHRALKLGGYSRIDFRADGAGDIFCLEANTLPGMTANSLIPKAARAAGIGFPDFCEAICRLAMQHSGTKD